MFRKLLIATAVSAACVVHPAFAQQQSGSQAGTQQPTQQSSQMPADANGAPVYLSSAGVRQIQQALNKQGFDAGNIDGQWSDQTAQAVQNYQQSKGMEPTGTLTLELVNSLGMNKLLSQTQKAVGKQDQVQAEGTPLYISPASVRQIQQALNKQGFDVGNVDGQWGESTAQAAINFQRSKGMEATGMPSPDLIAALGQSKTILSGSGKQASGSSGGMPQTQEATAGPGVQLWASPETVRQLEQSLSKKGFDVGQADGKWDETTAQAAQKFQKAQGMEPTGTLTPSLLASVGMNDWIQGKGGQQKQQQKSSGQSGGQSSGQSGDQQGIIKSDQESGQK